MNLEQALAKIKELETALDEMTDYALKLEKESEDNQTAYETAKADFEVEEEERIRLETENEELREAAKILAKIRQLV